MGSAGRHTRQGRISRYDYSTADRLLEIFGNLQKDYGGSLSRLYRESGDEKDLERRLEGLGKGIGPVTISVFLRDMRHVWPRADPETTSKIKTVMSSLGIGDLKQCAKEQSVDIIRLRDSTTQAIKINKKKNINFCNNSSEC